MVTMCKIKRGRKRTRSPKSVIGSPISLRRALTRLSSVGTAKVLALFFLSSSSRRTRFSSLARSEAIWEPSSIIFSSIMVVVRTVEITVRSCAWNSNQNQVHHKAACHSLLPSILNVLFVLEHYTSPRPTSSPHR